MQASKPTLTKARREWLASLRDGNDHEVARHNGRFPEHFAFVRIRWDEDHFRTVTGPRVCFRATGIEKDSHWPDWLSPVTDEMRHRKQIESWRNEAKRSPVWDKATDEQIERIAEILDWKGGPDGR